MDISATMSASSSQNQQEDAPEEEGEFFGWVIFEVILPIGLLFAAWIAASYIFGVNNAFISTFGSGDVLPITTLILIGCTVEIAHVLAYNRARLRTALMKIVYINIAIIVIVSLFYGAIKGAGLQDLDSLSKGGGEALFKLHAFAFVSLCLAFFQVVLAWHSKTKLAEMKIKAAEDVG